MIRRATLVWAALLVFASISQANPGIDFFEKKIRPVLSEHCYSCHSAEKRQRANLLLDTKEGVLKGGDTGPAIVTGKPDESLLIKAIRYDDPELKMPPKGKLSAEIIADLEKWVAMGAPDPRSGTVKVAHKYVDVETGRKFWAFQPPKMPAIPQVKDRAWPRNDIDRILLGGLEAKGLKPARNADPATLLRRLYFVLIGLPPTPEEIEQFEKSSSRDPQAAVVGVVDRLLASPHFGERWGRHWLDVARFAESSGGGRSLLFKDAWRYRDYVINAFNSDMPYTQFITEQFAGDLLEAKTPEERYRQLVATAFLLLGPHNYESQDKPILEMDIIDEQIDTMGKVFLGMTIGCARCHDHKFDPIPTKDYYALAGIFKSTKFIVHSNVSQWTVRPLPVPPEQEIVIKKFDAEIAALKEQLKLAKGNAPKVVAVETGVKGTPIAVKDLPGIVVDDSQAKKVGNWKYSRFNNNYIGDGYLFDDRAMKGEKTLTFQPEFTKTGFYEVRLAYNASPSRADKVEVRVFHTDGDDTIYVNQKQPPPIDGRFISLGRYRFEQGNQWFVMVTTEKANGHVIADAVQFLSDDDLKRLSEKPVAKSGDIAKIAPFHLATVQELEAKLKRLEDAAPARPTTMAVSDADKVSDFYVCMRGNVHNKGETVRRGFLQVATVGMMPEIGQESGRRELAAWLASADNPLTARVLVNRLWHHAFGAGIVRTADNFGATGELPANPELLDYLAVRFVQEGWSVKKMIREILLSHAFQMSCDTNEAGVKADPENRLLWRMNRRRVDAETLRDTMLVVSGKLDRTSLGDNIKPGTTVERDYKFEDTRRSVYTPIFRNRLLEIFEVFDFPDPNIVAGKRNISTVPTQALYLMNNPFVMTQARYAAQAALDRKDADDAARIEHAYRQCLGRAPTEREREVAIAYVSAGDDRLAAWERFYQALFACLDFRYVN